LKLPKDLKYTKDHEWIRLENKIATIGITDFAQSELGDIVYIEFPKLGDNYLIGESLGTIEAVKTVVDIYSPITGIILEINEQLEPKPELINTDPYVYGWIIKMETKKLSELDDLLTANEYKKFIN